MAKEKVEIVYNSFRNLSNKPTRSSVIYDNIL